VVSFTMQLSDEERLAEIRRARGEMDKLYQDLRGFADRNVLLSLRRAGSEKEIHSLKKLYGL
jgi:hypothetical protein